jgi:S1-C subfamily serine protease
MRQHVDSVLSLVIPVLVVSVIAWVVGLGVDTPRRHRTQPPIQTHVLFASPDWPATVSPLSKQVPRLVVRDLRGEFSGTCSGVVIAKGLILTAGHCVAASNLSITVNNRHASLERYNTILDLAVLKFRPKLEDPMPMAEKNPALGTEIAAAGFLLGAQELHLQFGRVSAYDGEGRMKVNVQVLPGDSGGPMLNKEGHLIGMTIAYYEGSSIAVAVPIETIRDFVADLLPTE